MCLLLYDLVSLLGLFFFLVFFIFFLKFLRLIGYLKVLFPPPASCLVCVVWMDGRECVNSMRMVRRSDDVIDTYKVQGNRDTGFGVFLSRDHEIREDDESEQKKRRVMRNELQIVIKHVSGIMMMMVVVVRVALAEMQTPRE